MRNFQFHKNNACKQLLYYNLGHSSSFWKLGDLLGTTFPRANLIFHHPKVTPSRHKYNTMSGFSLSPVISAPANSWPISGIVIELAAGRRSRLCCDFVFVNDRGEKWRMLYRNWR